MWRGATAAPESGEAMAAAGGWRTFSWLDLSGGKRAMVAGAGEVVVMARAGGGRCGGDRYGWWATRRRRRFLWWWLLVS